MKYFSPVRCLPLALCFLLCACACLAAENGIAQLTPRTSYFWSTASIGGTADLETLFCHGCESQDVNEPDIPLLSFLRDTLGDADPDNDRLLSLWLLTYSQPRIPQRVLSAIPFFYWRVGMSHPKAATKTMRPLLDLTALQHPALNTLGKDIVQWAMLDPSATPIRASSRAYRANESSHERLHLEQAISYLRAAPPPSGGTGPTSNELNTLIARLELRKSLLGSFVSERAAPGLGEQELIKASRIRSRNWELLRQWSEKTSLYFEPLNLAGSSGQFAMVWYPVGEYPEPQGTGVSSAWKLLHIKNPWRDKRLRAPSLRVYPRELDEGGNLLPAGMVGVTRINLAPLAAYSLSYPKTPLLLVDFRNHLHVKWHEMTQRSINEVTAGVIGISHFTNWYYYVAADAYNFISSRHGGATNQADRLDSYSQFRAALQLDSHLDADLRSAMQTRINALAVNPLEASPRDEISIAAAQYRALLAGARNGRLLNEVDKTRRAELASAGETRKQITRDYLFHLGSFGLFTRRVKPDAQNESRLDSYRRVSFQLALLDRLTANGTQPEVTFDAALIQHSVSELRRTLSGIDSKEVRAHASATLTRVRTLSKDSLLQADCSDAIAELEGAPLGRRQEIALESTASPAVGSGIE
jgi:hypothetical protein